MRTEYTIRIIDKNGKISDLVYPKKYADIEAQKRRDRFKGTGTIVQYFKVLYNGNSFYKAEKIF